MYNNFVLKNCLRGNGLNLRNDVICPFGTGSGETDFGPQLKGLDKERFTVVAFDPRGYGRSRPPNRDFPSDFFHRDAQDGLQLMQVIYTVSWCSFLFPVCHLPMFL